MSVKFSVEQFATLDFQRNWIVSTGAGAGKTTLLVERFLHLLIYHPDLKISQVLALTFSQKAAEEMRTRVYRGINERLLLTPALHRERLLALKEEFQECSISTIHSFCFKLLQTYPLEAGLDSRVELLAEFDRKKLLRESYEHVFRSFARKPTQGQPSEENQVFRALLEVWDERRIRQQTMAILQKPEAYRMFLDYYLFISKNPESAFNDFLAQATRNVCGALNDPDMKEKINALGNVEKITPTVQEFVGILNGILADCRALKNLETISERCKAILAHPAIVNKERFKGVVTPVMIRNWIQASGVLELTKHREWLGFGYLSHFVRFINEVKAKYDLLCRERNALDFDALQRLTLRLFKEHPKVLEQCRQKYRFVLVDEFQDTDTLQWQIIQDLAANGEGALAEDKLFIVGDEKQAIYGFRGGDVRVFRLAGEMIEKAARDRSLDKQPLFFESAERPDLLPYGEAFKELDEGARMALRLGKAQFRDNYRSHPRVLEFVNAFFAQLFDKKSPHDPDYENLVAGKKFEARDDDQARVTFLAVPYHENGADDDEEDIPDSTQLREARHVADYLKRVVTANTGFRRDIAESYKSGKPSVGILFRRFTKIKLYEEMLRQEGLEFFVHKGQGFFRRQEILDIYNLLEFLNDPRKDIPLIGLLRTAPFGFTDSDLLSLVSGKKHAAFFRSLSESTDLRFQKTHQHLRHFLQLKDRLRLSELLRRIIFETSASVVFGLGQRGKQTLFNVNKLIEMARNFESFGLRGLSEFCQFLRGQIDSDEKEGEAPLDLKQGSGIVLMTVHQSKGLEFPMVVLPDLNAEFVNETQEILDEVDDAGHVFYGFRVPDPNENYERKPTLAFQLIHDRAKQRNLSEEKRLFYVSCTRAMAHLVLVGQKMKEQKAEVEPKHRWGWIEKQLKFDASQSHLILNENLDPFPVVWYDSREPLLRAVPFHPIPEERMVSPAGYSIHIEPLKEEIRLRVTPTILSTFNQCSRKFYFGNILKLPEFLGLSRLTQAIEEREEDLSVRRETAALRGNILHKAMESGVVFGNASFEEFVKRYCVQEGVAFDKDLDVVEHLQKARGDLRLQAMNAGYHQQGVSEAAFEIQVEGVILQGAIDRLFRDPKTGSWVVLDFKTNQFSKNVKPGYLKQFVEEHGYDLQINAYALAAEKILKEPVGNLFLYFTDPNVALEPSLFEVKKDFPRIHRFLNEMHGMIQDAQMDLSQLRPKSKSVCERCGYFLHGVCHFPSEDIKG